MEVVTIVTNMAARARSRCFLDCFTTGLLSRRVCGYRSRNFRFQTCAGSEAHALPRPGLAAGRPSKGPELELGPCRQRDESLVGSRDRPPAVLAVLSGDSFVEGIWCIFPA